MQEQEYSSQEDIIDLISTLYIETSKPRELPLRFLERLEEHGFIIALKSEQEGLSQCVLWNTSAKTAVDLYMYLDGPMGEELEDCVGNDYDLLPTVEELQQGYSRSDIMQKRKQERLDRELTNYIAETFSVQPGTRKTSQDLSSRLHELGYSIARDEDHTYRPLLYRKSDNKVFDLSTFLDPGFCKELEAEVRAGRLSLQTIFHLETGFAQALSLQADEKRGQERFFTELQQIQDRKLERRKQLLDKLKINSLDNNNHDQGLEH